MPSNSNHECIHEDQIIGQSRKIAELEAKSKYKEDAIVELKKDNKRMEEKIDNISKDVNELLLQSKTDDTKLELRLTAIETELKTQKRIATENRNEDRSKTNIRIAIVGLIFSAITISVAILPFILR